MKWLFKWALRLGLLMIVLIVAVLLSLDPVCKALVERRIRAGTGMDVRIGRLSVSLLSPVVTVENLKLYNTSEFGGTPFLDIPELHVEYDRIDLARRKLHITLMRLNVAELDVVKNEAGQTNLLSLGVASVKQLAFTSRNQLVQRVEFAGIDVLNLSLGRLRYVDLKNPRNSTELDLDVRDRVFKNVKSEADLYGVFFLIWLRNGGNFKGIPMRSPPEIISTAPPSQKIPKTGGALGESRPTQAPR